MKLSLVLLLLLALCACSDADREPQCAALIGGGTYCLQPTTAVAPFAVTQKVEASFRGRRETLIVELESDADGTRFVVLTPFGHKVLQVAYDNRVASAALLPDQRLRPALLMALLQLAWWPADAVRAGLEAPLALAQDEGGRRRLLLRGEETLSITYSGEASARRMHISVPAADLELDIENLPVIAQ